MSKMDLDIGRPGRTRTARRERPQSKAMGTISLSDFFVPLAIIGALLVLVLTLGVHFAGRALDVGNAQREQALVQNGIDKRIQEVALMIVPQADWDDAVTNLDHSFDADWARANIGSFLNQTNGFDRAYVIDRDDRLLEGYVDGSPAPVAAYAPVAPAAAGLVNSVRKQEAARGAFTVTGDGKMISKPIQASALKMVAGKLTVMTATLVQPDFGTALPRQARAPIVITTMPVDEAFLNLFARRYLLRGLHLTAPGEALATGEAAILARDERGNALAQITWKPLAPGYSILRDLATPVALVAIVVVVLAAFNLRQIKVLAGRLIEREAFWRAIASRDAKTGLLNRTAFVDQLDFEIACLGEVSDSLAVLQIELGCGPMVDPEQGEELGRIVADRLKNVCREEALVSRLAGATFAILASGAGEAGAQALGKRVRAALTSPLSLNGIVVETRPRVGTLVVRDASLDANAILERTAASIEATPD